MRIRFVISRHWWKFAKEFLEKVHVFSGTIRFLYWLSWKIQKPFPFFLKKLRPLRPFEHPEQKRFKKKKKKFLPWLDGWNRGLCLCVSVPLPHGQGRVESGLWFSGSGQMEPILEENNRKVSRQQLVPIMESEGLPLDYQLIDCL